jgi:hypothetical protein
MWGSVCALIDIYQRKQRIHPMEQESFRRVKTKGGNSGVTQVTASHRQKGEVNSSGYPVAVRDRDRIPRDNMKIL